MTTLVVVVVVVVVVGVTGLMMAGTMAVAPWRHDQWAQARAS